MRGKWELGRAITEFEIWIFAETEFWAFGRVTLCQKVYEFRITQCVNSWTDSDEFSQWFVEKKEQKSVVLRFFLGASCIKDEEEEVIVGV